MLFNFGFQPFGITLGIWVLHIGELAIDFGYSTYLYEQARSLDWIYPDF